MADGGGFTILKGPPPVAGDLIVCPSAPLESARTYIEHRHVSASRQTLFHQNATFYTWEGSHYVERSAEDMRARLYHFLETAKRLDDEGELLPFNPNKSKVGNVLEALAAAGQLPTQTRAPTWLDAESHPDAGELIACSNGLLDLRSLTISAHTPAFFNLNALDFAYDPMAAEPAEWLQFLGTIWPDDPESIATLQEVFGLLLTGDTRYQKAFLIVGPKRSGKGTIARIMTKLLGAPNVCGPTLSSLQGTFGMETLIGKRLALISDARLSSRADQSIVTERLLSITGEDAASVDRKNKTAWFGKLDVRFVVMTNELPKLSDSSGALAGRFIVLKMTRSFYGQEDLALGSKLEPELPGILLWAIEGWRRLTRRGYFVTPASAVAAQQEMEDLGSPIGAFLREKCLIGQGYSMRTDRAYDLWCEWCREQGRDHPGTAQTFGRDLNAAVPGLLTIGKMVQGERFRAFSGMGEAF